MSPARRFLILAVLAGMSWQPAVAADSSLLSRLSSPILLQGDAHTAFRDALLFHHDGTFRLFFSYVCEEEDHLIYWYCAVSTSADLQHWSAPRLLTPKDQNLNYSSPGNIVRVGDEWILTLQSYPIANFRRGDKLRFTDDRARLFTMRSRDLERWSTPELIKVKGESVAEKDMGKMIDPFLLQDKDARDKWWCFYKQAGKVALSTSTDLRNWTPSDVPVAQGENPCVLVQGDEYVLFYAPENGIGVKRSRDLRTWREDGPPIVLGQADWPWAEARLTAGFVADLRDVPGVGKYVLVCHSMGPGKKKTDANTNAGCSIVVAWSDDLKTWDWPGKK